MMNRRRNFIGPTLVFKNEPELIQKANKFVKNFFIGESSGHDYYHTVRVFRTAKQIAEMEIKDGKNLDMEVVLLSALLHDVDDYKLSPNTHKNKDNAISFLKENSISEEKIQMIVNIINQISFVGTDSVAPDTIEGQITQDADRLDAIGAIGVGRAFAYGGRKGRAMFDPEIEPNLDMNEEEYKNNNSSTINHFYEKLLLLKDLMNTNSGKKLAEHRTRFMNNFLDEFFDEWDGNI